MPKENPDLAAALAELDKRFHELEKRLGAPEPEKPRKSEKPELEEPTEKESAAAPAAVKHCIICEMFDAR